MSEGIENKTDILTEYYFRINRKKSDYKLFSQRILLLLKTLKLGDNYSVTPIIPFEYGGNFGQFPFIRQLKIIETYGEIRSAQSRISQLDILSRPAPLDLFNLFRSLSTITRAELESIIYVFDTFQMTGVITIRQ